MGKAARRSVASDPSSPTLSYHYQQAEQQQQQHQQHQQHHHQQQQQQLHHQRQVHQQEHLYYPSSLSYSSYTPPASSPSLSSSSSSSSLSSFAASPTDYEPASGTPGLPSTPAGPQLQAPRTATLQSVPPAFFSSLAPGVGGGGGGGGQEPAEPSAGARDPFIHSSTAATPNRNITPEFSTVTVSAHSGEATSKSGPAVTEPTPTGRPTQATLLPSFRLSSNRTHVDRERERLRMEFYATYDVMTGVRIAATLGGFFGLMVFLVIYKSRTRSTSKALKDPTIAAVAAAVIQEEEERELQEAIEATAFSLLQEELNINYPGLHRDRLLSLGNVSAPPMLSRGRRMSSISGGYSSLLNPSRRFSYSSTRGHRNSVSVSSRVLSAYNMGGSFGQDDYVLESDGEEADDEFDQFTTTAEIGYPSNYLSVPNKCNESRRSSAMTCCSTESSFLERRCSAITLGLSSLPPISRSPSRQQSRDDTADWEPFYPGINIIEATPKSSPCPSERIAHRSGADPERPSTSRSRGSAGPSLHAFAPHPSTSSGGPRLVASPYDDSSIDCISEYPLGLGCSVEVEDGFGYRPRQPSASARHYGNGCIDDISIANGADAHQQHQRANGPGPSRNASNGTAANVNNGHPGAHPSGSGSAVRRAPLASLSSFKMSSADCQDTEPKSCGSDSVFGDDSAADTDEDLQQFSTDSDELSLTMPYEEEDEEAHRGVGATGQRAQRAGPSRGALYRRQSTLAQCDDDNDDDGDAEAHDALPSGPRTVCELEHELDHRQQQQQQHQLHKQPTTDTSYLSSLSISNRSGSKGTTVGRTGDRGQREPGAGGNRIETKAIIERQQLNDSTSNASTINNGNNNNNNTSSSVQSQQRQSPLGAIPKVPLDGDRARARSVPASAMPPIVTVHQPDDDRPSSSGRRSHHQHHHHHHHNTRSSSGEAEGGRSSRAVEPGSVTPRQQQQCVEVNVIIKNSSPGSSSNTIKSPSVILELPILAIDADDDDDEASSAANALSTNDPCMPGPSRKWSKETLF